MYVKNGRTYPSVTEIIRQASKFRDQRPGPSAAIGTYIHYHILKRYGRVDRIFNGGTRSAESLGVDIEAVAPGDTV